MRVGLGLLGVFEGEGVAAEVEGERTAYFVGVEGLAFGGDEEVGQAAHIVNYIELIIVEEYIRCRKNFKPSPAASRQTTIMVTDT